MRSWMNLAYHSAMLGFEAQEVIGLRLAKIGAGGPAAGFEAAVMISEKMIAAFEAAAAVASGGSPHGVVTRYRRKVRANRKRLKTRR